MELGGSAQGQPIKRLSTEWFKALKGGQRICTECRCIHDPLEVLEQKGRLATSSEGPFRKKTLLLVWC